MVGVTSVKLNLNVPAAAKLIAPKTPSGLSVPFAGTVTVTLSPPLGIVAPAGLPLAAVILNWKSLASGSGLLSVLMSFFAFG